MRDERSSETGGRVYLMNLVSLVSRAMLQKANVVSSWEVP
jgi:hypothetical protein